MPPGRPLCGFRSPLLRVRNHSQTGICVVQDSCLGRATMQSTRSASMLFLRMSPSPDWLDESEPLARTKPAVPLGGRVPEELDAVLGLLKNGGKG